MSVRMVGWILERGLYGRVQKDGEMDVEIDG